MDTRKEEQASLGVGGLPGCVVLRESHSCSEPPSLQTKWKVKWGGACRTLSPPSGVEQIWAL